MEKKVLISIVIAVIFFGSSLVGLVEIFFYSPVTTTTIQNFIISNATTFADVSFTGNFLIKNANSSLLEFVEELQKNGSIEYFNFVNGQIIGKAKDVEALKATNASVEAILSFSQPIEFFWYGSGFSVAPNNFKETTTFIPISMVDFSQHQPKVKVFILAQFSRNLSVISYSISLFQT
jgi:hypothetical protein